MIDIQESFQHQKSKQGLDTRHVKSVFTVFQLQNSPIIRFLDLEYNLSQMENKNSPERKKSSLLLLTRMFGLGSNI